MLDQALQVDDGLAADGTTTIAEHQKENAEEELKKLIAGLLPTVRRLNRHIAQTNCFHCRSLLKEVRQ